MLKFLVICACLVATYGKNIQRKLIYAPTLNCDKNQLLAPGLEEVYCTGQTADHKQVTSGGHCRIRQKTGLQTDVECREGQWTMTSPGRKLLRPKRWDWISGTVGDLASTMTCQSNYVADQPPTFTNCPPADIPVSSEYVIDSESRVITWTAPTATDNDGNTLSVSQETGIASGSVFKGSVWGCEHTVVYQTTDAKGLGASCKFTFTVRVRTCASLPWPDNGMYDCSSGNQSGSTCTFTCNAGYQLSGPSTATCQGSSWTTTPTCQKLSCGAPSAGMIDNADVTCGGATYSYGDTCTISCHVGYKLQGSLYTRCGTDGTWTTDQTTQCKDDSPPNIFCRSPQIFYADRGLTSTTVTPEVPVATDSAGASPTVTKVSGPVSGATLQIGIYTVQYEAEDSTGNKSPTCDVELRVQALTCGHPLETMTDTNMDFTCTGYSYGDQCDLDCFRNYPLQGTSLLTCERNDTGATPEGYWSWGSGSKPYCSEVVCPELDPPRNGELKASTVSNNTARTIKCNGNYIVPSMGENTFNGLFVCHSTGWSPAYASTPGCVNNRTAAVFRYKTEVLYYNGGDCSDPALLSGFQASFETIVSQAGTQLGALCPADVTCSAINPVAVCNPARKRRSVAKRHQESVNGRVRRSASILQHSLSKRQASGATLVLEFDVKLELDFSGMSVNDMYDYIDNLQNNTIEPGLETMKDNGDFDVAPWSLQSDSIAVDIGNAYCNSGYLLENWRYCMPCPSGYYLSGKQCLECPVGQYAPVEGAGACTSCPSGYSTRFTASMALDSCIKMCDAGTYSPDTFETCSSCPIGYYQNGAGQVSCVKCPDGKTTTSEGSTAESDCQDFDVLLDSTNGNVEVAGVSSLSDITLMFWVKAATDSPPNVVIDVNNVLTVSIATNIRIYTPTSSFDESFDPASSEAWCHVAVSWDTGASTLSVYISGQLVSQSAVTPPSSPLVQNGHVKVSSDGASGVYLSGLTLRDGVVSDTDVASIAQSCQLPSGSDVINMGAFSDLDTAGITVVAPSICDAIDECSSSPCGSHRCYNDAGGGYHCTCYGGWTGSTCDTPPSYCDFNDCVNGAACTSGATNYTCGCQSGYSGTLCEDGPVDGGLSAWTTWSECSATCNTGMRSRERSCDSPSADIYGSGCSGQLTETESCNTNTCPVCTPLVSDAGTGYQCTTDVTSGVQSCTVQCTSGYVLSRGLATYTYTCGVDTNYRWEPSSNPPSCVVPVLPNNVRLTSEVAYTTTIPSTQESDVKAGVSTNLAVTDCGTSSTCQTDVTLAGSTLRTESTISLSSYTSDPNYGQYVTSGIVSTSLQAFIDATTTLESTSAYVTSSVSTVFDVTTSGGTFIVDQTSLTVCIDAQCDQGYVQTNGLCAVCPSGSYQSSDLCMPCGQGSYQTQEGQLACTACPTDTTTESAGATSSSQCAVAASRQDTSPASGTTDGADGSDSNDSDDGSDSDNTLLFAVAAVVPTILIAAAVIVAACFWYRKRKGTDKTRPVHYPNVPGTVPSKTRPESGNSNSSFDPNYTNRNTNPGHNVPAVNQQWNGRTPSNRSNAQNVRNQRSSSRGEGGGRNGDGRGATGHTPPRSGRATRAWEHPKPDGFANDKGRIPTDFGYEKTPRAWGTLPLKAPPPYEKAMEAGVDKVQPIQRRGSRDGLQLTVDDLELQAQEYIRLGNQRIHDDTNGGFNVPRIMSPPPPYRP